jgi:hypothetical protein
MSWHVGFLLGFALLSIGCHSAGDRTPGGPFRLKIVPNRGAWDADEIHLSQAGDHFNVVLTNITEKPVTVWKEWSSWGYFCLSFQLTDDSGKPTRVFKKSRVWFANAPDPMTIPPGDLAIFDVSFNPSEWEGLPPLKPGEIQRVRMVAVYEVTPSKEADEMGVWVGTVSSTDHTYQIVR